MLAAWGVELALITARDLSLNIPGMPKWGTGTAHRIGGLPAPSDYLATFAIFAPLTMLADTKAHTLAELLGWGYVLATLLNMVNPTNPLQKKTTAPAAPTQTGTSNG